MWIFPIRQKYEVLSHFTKFAAYIQTQFSSSLKQFQSDGGKEFDNLMFKQFCATKGVLHRYLCPHNPQQNGFAGRKHRHIAGMGRILLLTAEVPLNLWAEAFCTAVHLINCLPTHVLQWASPFCKLYDKYPDYSFLRTFGCPCFPFLGDYVTNKLQPQSLACIFEGYSDHYHGYRCLHLSFCRLYTSRHVIFYEDFFIARILFCLQLMH